MSVQSIFREALEQTDLSQRAASLDRACAGDPDLRRRVEDLLRAYDQASGPWKSCKSPTPTKRPT